MKCHKCGQKFPANLAVSKSPGGQEAPGIFLVITFVLALAGTILLALKVQVWPLVVFGVAAFVAFQVAMAFFDCRNSKCPKCDAPASIRPWSF
jgi:Na+-translocating ferredoxin:NAD+ oxidoreductase RnfA subunit